MTTETQPKALSILRSIQADNLLQDLPLLTMLKGLRGLMIYREKSFADYFDVLQGDVSQLGHLQLRADVDPMTASSYLVDLAMGYERTLDDINRVTIEAQVFLGRLRVVHNKAITLKAPFMALWSIGAAEVLAASSTVKITATDLKALAASEFTGLVDEADLELAGMIEAMDLTIENLKNLRKLAQDKYAIGKDQVNAALSALDFEDKGFAQTAPSSHKAAASDQATMQGMFGSRVQTQLQPATATPAPALAPGEDDFPHAATDLDELDTMSPEQVDATFQQVVTELKNGGIASEAEEEHFQTVEKRQAALAGEIADFSATSSKMSEHPGQENLGSVDLDAPPTLMDAEGPGPLVAPETLIATPEGEKAVGDIQVGDKVLVIDPAGESTTSVVTSTPTIPELEKPTKGKPVVVTYHMHIPGPGHLLNVPGLLVGVGKTKVQLTAQADPTENGVYRWHGPDAALVRIEGEKAEAAPGPATAPRPPVLVAPDAHETVEVLPEATPAPKAEPQVVAPDAKALIADDPFISQEQKTQIIAKLEDDDDFPTAPTGTEIPPSTTGLGLDEDDDFPTAAPEPATPTPLADDDDDFPVGAEIIDRTPKPEDALNLEEKAPETPELESAKAPEPPPAVVEKPKQVVAPTPDPAAAAPKPGGLFRSRVLPPNQTAAPAFRPTNLPEVAGATPVSGDGLDEVL